MPKLSPEEVRALLDAERQRVVAQLTGLSRKNKAALEKEQNRRRKFRTRATALLNEGKQLGMSVTDMADAAGLTRQMAHHWLRDEG